MAPTDSHSEATTGRPMLSVVIPVYNEVEFVAELVSRVLEQPYSMELILVDDGSTDGTAKVLAQLQKDHSEVSVLLHPENRGKGAALRTGFEHATGEYVLIQDADLEYDPKDYCKLLEPLVDGRADVVYGSRFLGEPHRVLNFHHFMANQVLTFLSNLTTNLNLTDMETCYKVFRAEVLQGVELTEERFGFEPEITARMAQKGCRIYEVAISYSGRDYAEGKKITWKDGVAAVGVILRTWIRR